MFSAHRVLAIAAMLISANASAQSLPDPTRPPSYLPAPASNETTETITAASHRLSAIRIGAGGNTAVIDGRVVRIGDRVGEAVVRVINADGVTIEDQLGRRKLSLIDVSVRSRASAR